MFFREFICAISGQSSLFPNTSFGIRDATTKRLFISVRFVIYFPPATWTIYNLYLHFLCLRKCAVYLLARFSVYFSFFLDPLSLPWFYWWNFPWSSALRRSFQRTAIKLSNFIPQILFMQFVRWSYQHAIWKKKIEWIFIIRILVDLIELYCFSPFSTRIILSFSRACHEALDK